MTKKYFGTDGVRGHAGEYPMTADWVLKLGWSIGKVLGASTSKHGPLNKILLGKDTRLSGYVFESALEAGLTYAGIDVVLSGPIPTPAIAYLTRSLRYKAGIVVSASHNPYPYNGIKVFSSEGVKLSDAIELKIENNIENFVASTKMEKFGKVSRFNDLNGRYIEFCKRIFPFSLNLQGLNLVLDCANGSTYKVAPSIFEELGANITLLSAKPDGYNINEACGAMHLENLITKVIEIKASLGIAFDGDGDRVMMVDNKGEVVDGDDLLYILGKDYLNKGILKGGIVGTLMSNSGLELALKKLNIPFARSGVGDQLVFAELERQKWNLGGEPSGHIICRDVHTTGDGIITALKVLVIMMQSGHSLAELKQEITKFPQVIVNVPFSSKGDPKININEHPKVKKVVAEIERKLGEKGRVLIRPSGTEPLYRIMVEGENAAEIQKFSENIAEVIQASL